MDWMRGMPGESPGIFSMVTEAWSGVRCRVSGIRWHKTLGQRAKGGRSRPCLLKSSALLSQNRFLLLHHRSDGLEDRLDVPPRIGGRVHIGMPPAVSVHDEHARAR